FSVHRCVTTGRCGRGFTAGIFKEQALLVSTCDTTHVVLAAIPGPLVHRLFLTPDDALEVLVGRDGFGQILFGERIQLLDANNGDIFATFVTTLGQQVVVHLAGTQDQTLDLGRIESVDSRDPKSV